jgi:hypothetical protein
VWARRDATAIKGEARTWTSAAKHPGLTRDEIVISAPMQTVWDIQTDMAGWPSRQPDVDGADADGPLDRGRGVALADGRA